MKPWLNVYAAFFLVALLAGCSALPEKPLTLPELLGQLTVEITAAANTLADGADAGVIDRESDWYKTLRDGLESAGTYVELAWGYYFDGEIVEANGARQLALQTYTKVRSSLKIIEAKLLEAQ